MGVERVHRATENAETLANGLVTERKSSDSVPSILDDDHRTGLKVYERFCENHFKSLDDERTCCVTQSKNDDAGSRPFSCRNDLTEVEIEREDDAILRVGS